ncbi:MAG TPA: hypothetical protein VGX68_14575 [Thermoanaerobaculia bacterium]|nr:hypothetical protein [Thermoanaerobaculia bacterium]
MKRSSLILGLAAMAMMTAGCAITDYDGVASHQTASEAKLWGSEIAFITGDPALDGTYAYTVKYDNRNGRDPRMKILSYRNPIPSSFSRDGVVDRDGDDVQGRKGVLGGTFAIQYVAVDPAPDCQFFANITQDHSGVPGGPPIAFCTTVNEEVDKDLELQADFSSLGDLLSQLWSGAVTGSFTMELTGLSINGTDVPLGQTFSIGAKSNGVHPTQWKVDLTRPGGAALIQTLLNNTADGVPTRVGLTFSGGMQVDLPSQIRIVFSHAALSNLL